MYRVDSSPRWWKVRASLSEFREDREACERRLFSGDVGPALHTSHFGWTTMSEAQRFAAMTFSEIYERVLVQPLFRPFAEELVAQLEPVPASLKPAIDGL